MALIALRRIATLDVLTGGLQTISGPLKVLTVPRASLTESRPFDPANLVPGVAWSEEDDEADLGGALELAVE